MHIFKSILKFSQIFFYNFIKLATVCSYSLKKRIKKFNNTIIALRNVTKGNYLAYIGAQNQGHACRLACRLGNNYFPCKRGLTFLTSTKCVHCGIKVTLPLERTIRGALNQATLLLASTLMDR